MCIFYNFYVLCTIVSIGIVWKRWLICVHQPQLIFIIIIVFIRKECTRDWMAGERDRAKIFTFYFILTSLRSLNSNLQQFFCIFYFQCWMLLSSFSAKKLLIFSLTLLHAYSLKLHILDSKVRLLDPIKHL